VLEDVSVAVQGRPLLTGLQLQLHGRDRVAITGPSGCGKTTLLRAVAALIDVSAGTVRLAGGGPEQFGFPGWRRRVTYVGQPPVMFPGSVMDNLRRPSRYGSVRRDFQRDRAVEWLEDMGLARAFLEQDVATLSSGERQRVALARAMGIEPNVLLADEPTSALDPQTTEAVERALAGWTERGGALLAVTHDLEGAKRWCTRQLDLREYSVEARHG
jgi:putative ABC transport system ATP-binding protein